VPVAGCHNRRWFLLIQAEGNMTHRPRPALRALAATLFLVSSAPPLRAQPAAPPPGASRLFFGPTARALPPGRGYFGVYQLFLPVAQVGVTERFSLGAGTPLLFLDATAHPIWVTPKLQLVSSDRLQAAVGGVHVVNVGDTGAGVAYGVVTAGTADRAVTAGVGWGYADGGRAAIVMLGLEHRLGDGARLLGEAYVFPGGGMAIGGLRLTRQRLSADVGLATRFAIFPIVNFAWAF
jgi:hypothetical protein